MRNVGSKKHLLQIALTTNIFEWYEFSVFGYLSVVIGQLFFKSQTGIIPIIQGFSIFTISYLVRPIGSLFFGYISNTYGVNLSLRLSIILMAFPTFLIGILPTYSYIGYVATGLLILLRFIQGFAAGGELPISAYYVYSHAQQNNSLFCAIVNSGSLNGVLCGSFVVYLLYLFFPQATINAWAWRIPFLLGLPLLIILISIQNGIKSIKLPTQYDRICQTTPIIIFAKAIGLVAFLQASFYTLFVWLPTYLQYFLFVPGQIAKISNVLALISTVIVTILSGYVGQFFEHVKMVRVSLILTIIFVYPLFVLLQHASFTMLLVIQLLFALLIGIVNGVIVVILGNLFKNYLHGAGMAISFTIPTALFGGTAPAICTYFTSVLNLNTFPGLYLILFGVIALLTTYL